MVTQFPDYLDGYAAEFYRAATTSGRRDKRGPWTWVDLKKVFFKDGFVKHTETDNELKLLSRKQKVRESCLEYFFRMDNLANKVDERISDQKRIKHVIRGLRDDVKKMVIFYRLNNTEKLKTLEKVEQSFHFTVADSENEVFVLNYTKREPKVRFRDI